MLCLTRKIGESVMIGDDIVVKVLRIDHGRVMIGIDAPEETEIDRAERLHRKSVGMSDADGL